MNYNEKIEYIETLNLHYWESKYTPELKMYSGGVPDPKYLDELVIKVRSKGDRSKHQICIKGTKRALKEFGKYLINLSNYKTVDPNYHNYFDDSDELKGNSELTVYHPDSRWYL